MGNRGRLHNPTTKKLIRASWTTQGWVACRIEFKDRHREVMGNGYTELFFLDEVTALAAGHRPCFVCRRSDAKSFVAAARKQLKRKDTIRAKELNQEILRDIKPYLRKHHPCQREKVDPRILPDGAMFALGDTPFLKLGGAALSWTIEGYGVAEPLPKSAYLLTPRFTCAALAGGFQAQIDASAMQ